MKFITFKDSKGQESNKAITSASQFFDEDCDFDMEIEILDGDLIISPIIINPATDPELSKIIDIMNNDFKEFVAKNQDRIIQHIKNCYEYILFTIDGKEVNLFADESSEIWKAEHSQENIQLIQNVFDKLNSK